MKKHAEKEKTKKPVKRNRINPALPIQPLTIRETRTDQPAELRDITRIRPENILYLQHQFGNTFVQKQLVKQIKPEIGIQRQEKKEETLLDVIAAGILNNPALLAGQTTDILKKVKALQATMYSGNRLWASLDNVAQGMVKLIADLKKMPATSKTTLQQQNRFKDLLASWREIEAGVAADNQEKLRKQLAEAESAANYMQVQMLYAYHDIFSAGQEPGKVKMGDLGTVLTLANRIVGLIQVIKAVDASMLGLSVDPLVPVLKNTLQIANMILNWKVTNSLAPELSQDLAFLQKSFGMVTAGIGLAGLGRFLPLFSHLPILLNGLAKGWERVVSARKEQGRIWWNVSLETKKVHRTGQDLPGGQPVENYMKKMFTLPAPPTEVPSKKVLNFFYDNKMMIDRAMKEVMGQSWNKLPTRSKWIFFSQTNPEKINEWVYYNRVTLWRLIYGRGHALPDKYRRL